MSSPILQVTKLRPRTLSLSDRQAHWKPRGLISDWLLASLGGLCVNLAFPSEPLPRAHSRLQVLPLGSRV